MREISPIMIYKRLGTCTILAALDLHDGHITARVERRHRSVEVKGLLTDLDAWYPPNCTIRIILGNHSAHISKETSLSGSTSEPIPVRTHTRARLLAQHR